MDQPQWSDVVLEPQPEGGFVVSVPDLPGCWTEGETFEEALAMAKDAIDGYLETLRDVGRPIPRPEREHVTVRA